MVTFSSLKVLTFTNGVFLNNKKSFLRGYASIHFSWLNVFTLKYFFRLDDVRYTFFMV